MDHYTLILAAGKGNRLNNKTPKQFLEINGLPMVMHSVIKFNQAKPNSKIFRNNNCPARGGNAAQ